MKSRDRESLGSMKGRRKARQGPGTRSPALDRDAARGKVHRRIRLRGLPARRHSAVPPHESPFARHRAENQHQRRRLQNDGQHQPIPEGLHQVRRRRRGPVPDDGSVGQEERRAGHHHHLCGRTGVLPPPGVSRALPGTTALGGESARIYRGAAAGRRGSDRAAGRLQQGCHPGRSQLWRHAEDSARQVSHVGA
ncbi:uncharacterized protein LOC6040732 isoform X1 [Culex quinquefasciatus]|uniref:uncharacterized protein LOC6040732 isoform X1 n=1 Tax=Culex quinquefasciatus TaxID=7176 RepID=UPI0018E35A62|nr:uncharacterized protein LOC6040732 isoform X1 [Culex quinquefasciatus]